MVWITSKIILLSFKTRMLYFEFIGESVLVPQVYVPLILRSRLSVSKETLNVAYNIFHGLNTSSLHYLLRIFQECFHKEFLVQNIFFDIIEILRIILYFQHSFGILLRNLNLV